MKLSARGPRRAIQRTLAALATAALIFGAVPSAFAAESADTSRIEPSLLQAVEANPGASYHVIVTRTGAGNKAKARLDESDVEQAVQSAGGSVQAKLGLVDGHAVTLSGRKVLSL